MQSSVIALRFGLRIATTSIKSRNIIINHAFNCTAKPNNHLHQQNRNLSQSSIANFFSLDLFPIKCAYTILNTVHSTTGLPWWATILGTTFFLRTTITLPIFIISAKNSMKLEALKPHIVKMSDDLKLEISRAQKQLKWDQRMAYNQYKSNVCTYIFYYSNTKKTLDYNII